MKIYIGNYWQHKQFTLIDVSCFHGCFIFAVVNFYIEFDFNKEA
jgi:hypothetical protein